MAALVSANASEPTQTALDEIDSVQPTTIQSVASQEVSNHDAIVGWAGLICFFAPGLIVAGAIGVSASVMGTFVLLRRESLLALALPQVVATGAAVGLRMGWPTLPPALVAVSVALGYVIFTGGLRDGATRGANSSASLIPALYVSALSLSFLIIAHGGQHVEELQNLFTGIDVAVTSERTAVAAPLLLLTGLACAGLWRRWLLIAQSRAAAELAGLRASRWDALFLSMLALVLLLGTDSQGVVMVLAMLFLPPAIVAPWAARLPSALMSGMLVSAVCLAAAFVLSNHYSWPLSQSVGGAGFSLLIASHAVKRIVRHLKVSAALGKPMSF